jgi:hypothetical protein
LCDFEKSEETAIANALHSHSEKVLEDSLTCGCDTTDSMRYHLRANKVDLSFKQGTSIFKKGTRIPGGACGLFMVSSGCTVLMESPLIAKGAEISRIEGFVKIAKIERKVQAPR